VIGGEIPFGTHVLVRAQTVRVFVDAGGDGVPVYKQSSSSRDVGRYVRVDVSGRTWPGAAIPETWEPAPPSFEVSPPADGVHVRLRRLLYSVEKVGVIVGHSKRQEGTVRQSGDDDGKHHLGGPGRTILVYEVALDPGSSRRAQLVLAHDRDVHNFRAAR
jgi:hypothetical protein